MGIKSKNIRYSKFSKAMAIFLLWVSVAGFCVSAVYFLGYSKEPGSKNFHTTNDFINEFKQYTYSAVTYAVRLRSEEYIIGGNTIPAEVRKTLESMGIAEYKQDTFTKEDFINIELQQFRDLGKQLSSISNFACIVINKSTGTFVTNMKIESSGDLQKNVDKLKKQPFNIFISKDERKASYPRKRAEKSNSVSWTGFSPMFRRFLY